MTIENRGSASLRRLRFEIGEGRFVGIRRQSVRIHGRKRVVCTSPKTRRRVSCKRRPKGKSVLVRRKAESLTVSVERCPTPWLQLPGKVPAYRCPTKIVGVVAWTPVPARRVLRNTRTLQAHERAYLRVTLRLPARATNALQRQTAVLVPRITASGGIK
jgi:hypothetical protein